MLAFDIKSGAYPQITQHCATHSATLRVNSARDPPIFVHDCAGGRFRARQPWSSKLQSSRD
jgi:hypothetical protein